MLLAMNSMLMNQQCILCSLSLNRSTYETRLCLVLVVVIGDTQETNPMFSLQQYFIICIFSFHCDFTKHSYYE